MTLLGHTSFSPQVHTAIRNYTLSDVTALVYDTTTFPNNTGIKCTTDAAQGWIMLDYGASAVKVGVVYYYRNHTTPIATFVQTFHKISDIAATKEVTVEVTERSTIRLRLYDGVSTSYSTSEYPCVVGETYRIEYKIDSSAVGTKISWGIAIGDGPLTNMETDFTGGNTLATNTWRYFLYGHQSPNTSGDYTIANTAVGDSAGDYPIGPITHRKYLVGSVGTHNLDAATSTFFFKEVGGVDSALTTSETTSYQTIDDSPIDADVDAIYVALGGSTPATPAFRAAGTTTFSGNNVANGALTPGTPAGKAVGDLLILIAATSSNSATVTTPTGWTVISGFPKASGTAVGGKIYAYTRIADGTATDTPAVTFASLTTGTSGTPGSVVILAYTGATATLDGTVASSDLAAQTTTSVIPAFTTATNNSLVIGVALKMLESSGQTSTVATFTERVDQSTTSGIGYALEVSEKIQAVAGSSGTATVTWSATGSARAFTASFGLVAGTTLSQPTNTWYAEEQYTDESTLTQAPTALTAYLALKQDSAATAAIVAKLYDGTNSEDIYNDLAFNVGTTKTYKSKLFLQRPNTGGAWTLAALNALTLRFGFTADADGTPRLEATQIEVMFPVVRRSLPIANRKSRQHLLRR